MSQLRKATLDEIHAFRQQIMEVCSRDIARCTIPLYGPQNGRPVQNGSGVLLQIGEYYFLLSAAHVLDVASIHKIPYYLAPGVHGEYPIPLNGVTVKTSPIPSGRRLDDPHMRNDDPLDVAVCELTSSIAQQITPLRRFARLIELHMTKKHEPARYLMMGYPFAFSNADETTRTIFSDPIRHVTELHRGEIDERDAKADILLSYPEEAIDSDGQKATLPKPYGVSGCGIWRLNEPGKPLDLWKLEDKKLVAIEHRWRPKNRYIRGTSIGYALA